MRLKPPARWPNSVALFDWSHNIGFEHRLRADVAAPRSSSRPFCCMLHCSALALRHPWLRASRVPLVRALM